MKAELKVLLRLMAVAGGMCFVLTLCLMLRSMESKARRYFSEEDRVDAMISLFHKLDSAKPSELGLIELDEAEVALGFPKSWKLPRSMVPENFQQYQRGDDAPFANFGCVLAHHDGAGKLATVEFHSSRMGCFVYRDPTVTLPPAPGSRIPIRTTPIFITARAHGD